MAQADPTMTQANAAEVGDITQSLREVNEAAFITAGNAAQRRMPHKRNKGRGGELHALPGTLPRALPLGFGGLDQAVAAQPHADQEPGHAKYQCRNSNIHDRRHRDMVVRRIGRTGDPGITLDP